MVYLMVAYHRVRLYYISNDVTLFPPTDREGYLLFVIRGSNSYGFPSLSFGFQMVIRPPMVIVKTLHFTIYLLHLLAFVLDGIN